MPGRYDLDLYRGDSYSWVFKMWEDEAMTIPINLGGCFVHAQIRDRYPPGSTRVMDLTCTVTIPSGGTVANQINVNLTPVMWDDSPGPLGVWDLEIEYPGGEVKTPLAGQVTVHPDVTNPVVP